MQEAYNTQRRYRRIAINLLIVAALSAAYITYRYVTTSATTVLSWIFLIVALLGAIHYLRISRR